VRPAPLLRRPAHPVALREEVVGPTCPRRPRRRACALMRWRAVRRAGASETKALCANCGRVTVVIEQCLSTWVSVRDRGWRGAAAGPSRHRRSEQVKVDLDFSALCGAAEGNQTVHISRRAAGHIAHSGRVIYCVRSEADPAATRPRRKRQLPLDLRGV